MAVRLPVIDRHALRRDEIARLDATSRERALTDRESVRLERLLYRDLYAPFRQQRRAA